MRYFFLSLILVMVMGCGNGEVKDITYDLEIHHGELEEKQSLEANKGDTITFNVNSDSSYVLHLHGYDLEAELQKGQNNTILTFEANATGKFDIALHEAGDEHSHHSHDHGAHGAEHEKCENQFSTTDSASPSINLEVDKDSTNGSLIIKPNIKNFTLVAGSNDKNEHSDHNTETTKKGHWHLYLNNELKGMYHMDTLTLKDLEPGDYKVRVALSSTSHCEYNISDEVAIEIMGEKKEHDGHGHGHGGENIIASLEVYP